MGKAGILPEAGRIVVKNAIEGARTQKPKSNQKAKLKTALRKTMANLS